MINLCYNFWKSSNILDKKLKIFIIYIAVGCLIYLVNGMDISYLNFLYYAIVHPYLLTFFLTPTIFFYIHKTYKTIKSNYDIALCLNTRSKYTKFIFINIFFIILWWIFLYLFIVLVIANIFASREQIISIDPNYEEISNLVGFLISLFKLLIFIFSYSILYFFGINFAGKYKCLIIIFILFSLFTMMGYIDIDGFFAYIFPYRYIGFVYTFKSFKEYAIKSTIYCLVNMFIAIISLFSLNRWKDL